ncbi:aspartate kinase (plasmid) [Gemmatirosa kalamazoonensis]|uniref:Aspartate kinase n=1 Tax=Gemmatirosa kalamazoonensis TaxID=861299 RepID=W0RN72_9BACT|nr:aspartate kinase [Gemmatirosa kalamazoonensis]AHG92484.1 aspartate kinase [Gemmatirosa kalamazoonensis]
MAVYKFGGASLATPDAVAHAVSLVARRDGAPTVVVTSALAGVTDALLAVAHAAATATPAQLDAALGRLRATHAAVLDALLDGDDARTLHDALDASLAEVAALAAAARAIGELAPREVDRVVARGERLAARIVAAALGRAGVRAEYVDATDLVVTDGAYGEAAPDLAATAPAARRVLRPLLRARVVPVVPGFVGRGPRGETVTLGRGGSDLSATVLAAALGARRVVLWKDVPGLLTADPRAVPNARVVPRLGAREAAALAHYGAKVLHPRALAPLALAPAGKGTRVLVRPFARPDERGTEIVARRVESRAPVVAVAATMDQAIVRVVGRGLHALPGVAARALAALHAAGVPVSLVSQAASAYDVSVTVDGARAAHALDALRRALAPELASGELESVDARVGVATVGVVGACAADDARAAARALTTLADAGIAPLATAQGAAGASLSLVVDATRAVEAQRALHEAFRLHEPAAARTARVARTDVVLLGAGAIGRELAAQIAAAGARSPLRVCALVDRSGFVFDAGGLSRRRIAELCGAKVAGRPLALAPGARAATAAEALDAIAAHRPSRPVLVDVTAADTGALLERALGTGWDVVLANKVPLAAPQEAVDRLHAAGRAGGGRLLHEATVGAGLPVIDTLRKLLEAGDRVQRIEGCPSGTLGFLFGELGRGLAFSAALRDAMARGYTEPDPRDDLSGQDVARKALILARLLGFRGDLSDVAVESLVPEAMRALPRDAFLARLAELDAPWEARVRAARAQGRVLRYRVRVTRRRIAVGLVAVAPSDPLGALSGTDNQFAFTTARYRAQPLVVTGPGAGAAVTASGVYGDLLRLAAERR